MENKDIKVVALKRIISKLNISVDAFSILLDKYNERIFELNQRVLKYAETFLTENIMTKKDGSYEHALTQDDKDILDGFKKNNLEILEKEFPELFEVMDDLCIFEKK